MFFISDEKPLPSAHSAKSRDNLRDGCASAAGLWPVRQRDILRCPM